MPSKQRAAGSYPAGSVINSRKIHLVENLSLIIFQPKPTPLAISVAKKGIEAKPINSILTISLNLEAKFSVTSGSFPLLNGIAHKT